MKWLDKDVLYTVIFGTETPAGRRFDIGLIIVILLSIGVLLLDSMGPVRARYGSLLYGLEWGFTLLFTLEYGLRVYCAQSRAAYVRSFYGVIDLLAVLPTYLAIFIPGASFLMMVRLLRVLRIFRVLKLMRYVNEANTLLRSLNQSRRKILVFFSTLFILVTLFGSLLYVVEGPENGFTSIPTSIYWAIVTITTVGFGDITPQTPLGRAIAAVTMLMGYAIIAVPTGIITAELGREMRREQDLRHCPQCDKGGHDRDARFCKHCGGEMEPTQGA
ncbi:ion transporter [Zobellella taiwanensis]|jgi:voltage-gated potassium channel|uniref:Ion transporter n=1 Tax=Zobellella taiwanensis TaxID=347535 RepID=A0A2P7R105_9GAMM|nr:ion transporter [Zobellella taiwanensis]PSJ43886.1 ion transporter [Zobellella taiwanensis]